MMPYNCTESTEEAQVPRKVGRIEARLSTDERRRIDRAAQLAGQSVSSFVVGAAVEKADALIAESTVTPVPAEYFDRLLTSIDEADPAPRLARAAADARRRRRIR
jgi:uncharacterized protein (DUF1778 family)